jgi:hypothetical protein
LSDWTFHVPSNSPLFSVGLFRDYGTAGTAWVGSQAASMLVIRLLAMVGLLGIYLAGWDVVCLRMSDTGTAFVGSQAAMLFVIRLLVMVGLLGIYLAGGDAVCLRIIDTGCLVGAGIMASIYWLVMMVVYFKGCFIYWDCIVYD